MLKIKLGDRVELKVDFLSLKIGHQGVVVGDIGDLLLVLFDNYHGGHDGGDIPNIKYLKGYSYERLREIDSGCWWVIPNKLQPIRLLKSWKGKVKSHD